MFPRASISFIELDAKCAESYRAAIAETGGQVFVGPQASPSVMSAAVAAGLAAGGYDLIVDDGGHRPEDQRASLVGLWPALRPGGLYVVSALTARLAGISSSGREWAADASPAEVLCEHELVV